MSSSTQERVSFLGCLFFGAGPLLRRPRDPTIASMRATLPDIIAILRNTPAVLRSLLRDLDAKWIGSNYGKDTFSPFDVVGHLIHGENTDWIPRARIILEHGEARAFEPFDRYAMYEASKGRTIAELLDEFESLRRENLRVLEAMNLTEADFARRGTHPALGPVTLGQLLATWAVHDLNHIHQIAKCMAWQYKDEIGPWREYVGVLGP
jgi:hypothetical protein